MLAASVAACLAALACAAASRLALAVRRRARALQPVPTPDRFDACLAPVLEAEGGFVDRPADPGGATRFGITRAALADWRGHAVGVEDVRRLTRGEAAQIYRRRYWEAMRCAELPPGIDLMVLDCAVNSGPRRSALILQQACKVAPDGLIGPATLAAAGRCDAAQLIDDLAAVRLAFCRGLVTFSVFGRGWERRIEAMRKQARGMVRR
jgi:lysozyme family protein